MVRLIISLKLVLNPESEEYKLAMKQLILDREDILEACKFQNEEELLLVIMSLAEYYFYKMTLLEQISIILRSQRRLNRESS